MAEICDIVVPAAGVAGASTAFHLARARGVGSIS